MVTSAPPETYGQLVDIGGRRLCVRVAGRGSPTVVFENGAGSPSLVWAPLQQRIMSEVTTVAYDHAGIGWSDPGSGPRTGDAVIEDLRRLLDAVDASPPYVMVAHSAGALYARLFQATHPDLVAGMVFVDAVGGETYEQAKRELGPLVRTLAQVHQRVMPPVMAVADRVGLLAAMVRREDPSPSIAADETLLEAHREFWRGRNLLAGSRAEGRHLQDTANAVSRLAALTDLPIAVVRAGDSRGLFQRIKATWSDTQQRLAALSTRSSLITAPGAGHFVQLDRSELVADAVMQVVGLARKDSLPPDDCADESRSELGH